MKDHSLEEQLRNLPTPELPETWQAEILATARREAQPPSPAPAVWSPFFLWLYRFLATSPYSSVALALCWIIIIVLRGTTPVDQDAQRMLLAQKGPVRPIDLNLLNEQIRLAELLQESPDQTPRMP